MSKNLRVNEKVRAREVRVIDEDGTQLGIMHPLAALDLARQKGLDLVEVAPNANPPVCRLMDYGKFRYEQTKKERESRKSQKQIVIKEVRLKPKIDVHDLQTKAKQARNFLEEGDKVKVTVQFRGREVVHPEIGQELVQRLMDLIGDAATIEQQPKLDGKNMTALLAPRKESAKPKKANQPQEESTQGEAKGDAETKDE
ncbi:translation initiation factor IF-3 [Thermobaculum terrenum]|uniref:translation initiation factor IF-3 n=1 Tax=Thermobaculum terrenum TaxID=166501 RepID=UPI000675C908